MTSKHRHAALVALLAALFPATAAAQELVYCDVSVPQQTTKLELTFADLVMTGERKKQGIRLTEEKINDRGSSFHRIPIAFPPGTSLYVHFRMRISGANANAPSNGAEGLTFIVQNDPGGDPLGVGKLGEGFQAFGGPGGGMCYEGITQSFALEFDTSKQADRQDPDGNHIAFDLGGMVTHTKDGTKGGMVLPGMPFGSSVAPYQPVVLDPMKQSLESTTASSDTRDVWLDYECSAPNVCTAKVYMAFNTGSFSDVMDPSTLPMKPAEPTMVVENLPDIASHLKASTGFAGFAAATGMTADEHLVTYWVVGRTPLLDSDMNNLEDACECAKFPSLCVDNLPICDTSAGQGFCRDCQQDSECAANHPERPICDIDDNGGTGACVECLVDAHCLNPDAPYCNPAVRQCTGKCTNDTMCSDDEWCDNPTAAAFGGDCLLDLPNGEPIPSSAMHTPPLEGKCTPDAAVVVCASRVCDEADDLCGYTVGTGPCNPATAQVVCRSGVCDANQVCGCTADAQCGDTASGRVCDVENAATMNQCVEGCRGAGEGVFNGCPMGLECTSLDDKIGKCVKPVEVPGPKVSKGYVEGAGLVRCGAAGGGGSGQVAAIAMLAALGGHLARRRRRQ
jgi:hypothetical protein